MAEQEGRLEIGVWLEIEIEQPPRRSARLALAEIQIQEAPHETPNKNVSADEMVIIQRGPRRKPVTWSPVDLDRTPASKRPQKIKSTDNLPKRPSLNPKTRRRLILSPTKSSSELGSTIARKLRALPRFNMELVQASLSSN